MMAMRKEPDRRYGSVEQFSADLDLHLRGMPVLARQDTWSYRARKFVARHTLGVSLSALVVLLLAGYAASMYVQAERLRAERDRTHAQSERAEAERNLAAAKSAGNTLGGEVEIIARGLPVGLGSHVSWDRKLDGRLAGMLMAIPAIKAVEIGLGVEAARRPGSDVHDAIERDPRVSEGDRS